MKQIRHSIFETNSSSSHSIVFDGTHSLVDIYIEKQNINLNLYDEDYSSFSGPMCYTFREKLTYCWLYALRNLEHMKNFLTAVEQIEEENGIHIYMDKKFRNLTYDWEKDCYNEGGYINADSAYNFTSIFDDSYAIYKLLTNQHILILPNADWDSYIVSTQQKIITKEDIEKYDS